MARPYGSDGGEPCTRLSQPKAPSALKALGGANTAVPHGITSAWRIKAAYASGCFVPGSIVISGQGHCPRRGSCTGHSLEIRMKCHALFRICCRF